MLQYIYCMYGLYYYYTFLYGYYAYYHYECIQLYVVVVASTPTF